nr:MAG: hypothetical protein [Microvirus sp.]
MKKITDYSKAPNLDASLQDEVKNELDETVRIVNKYIDDLDATQQDYNPVYHTQIFTHRRLRKREVWLDPTPTVVPGLAPSISAIMAQQKMGLPNTIATRTLETYYKNMDLTDVQELNNAYLDLAKVVEQNHKSFKFHQDQAKIKQQADAKRITDYLDAQAAALKNLPPKN